MVTVKSLFTHGNPESSTQITANRNVIDLELIDSAFVLPLLADHCLTI